jgi:hypothetical protein
MRTGYRVAAFAGVVFVLTLIGVRALASLFIPAHQDVHPWEVLQELKREGHKVIRGGLPVDVGQTAQGEFIVNSEKRNCAVTLISATPVALKVDCGASAQPRSSAP